MHSSRTIIRTTTTGLSRASTLAGRVLILLSVLLLAVTPFTEKFFDFDHFLRGGQDFEFGFLALLVVLCLVLLLGRNANQRCSLVLTLRRWLRFFFPPRKVIDAGALVSFRALLDDQPIPSLSLFLYTLPLQI